jgi:hypothetical protein
VPNWCSNRLKVDGGREDLIAFLEVAGNGNSILADALLAARVINPANEQRIVAAVLDSTNNNDLLSFNGHVPEPEFEGEEWYHWRTSNWGVKWDIGQLSVDVLETNGDQASMTCYFTTPWGPPDVWFATISRAHQSLTMEMVWNEEQGFGGVYRASHSSCTHTELDTDQLEKLWPAAPYLETFEEEDPEDKVTV